MKKLTQKGFDLASQYILNNARYLEKLYYEHYFISPCDERIIKAMEMYQNKDGGYGNALEPDFRLPHSSAMATSIALRNLNTLKINDNAEQQIKKALSYLESTFKPEIKGWEAVPKMVNIYPHAPWWHRKDNIDYISGNPSAELAGYLYKFREHISEIDVESLIEFYISRLENLEEFEEHELYCYIELYDVLPVDLKDRMMNKMIEGYEALVSNNPEMWTKYVPYPLKFIGLSKEFVFPISSDELEQNLDYIVDLIDENGHLVPTWEWSDFEAEWEVAKREWTGKLTLDHLVLLKRFNRLDSYPLQK